MADAQICEMGTTLAWLTFRSWNDVW